MAEHPQGEELGRMKPLSSRSCNCTFISAKSLEDILWGLRKTGAVPGRSSRENSTARSGGRPGRSSGKTSGYSLTTGIAPNDSTSRVHTDPEGTGCSGRERIIRRVLSGAFRLIVLVEVSITAPCCSIHPTPRSEEHT